MSLSNLATALIVPPVNLVPLSLAGLALTWRYPRVGRILVAVGLAGLLLLAMPIVADSMVDALETGLPLTPPDGDPPQAIVILTAEAVRSTTPPFLQVGPLGLERARAGAALERQTGLPILVTGGMIDTGRGVERESLAEVMAQSLEQDFRVPVRWQEQQSIDTWENAQLSATILKAKGIHSIYLVTHAWHMRRALIAFARTGITVTAALVRLDTMATAVQADFVPRAGAWLASYYALHEWIGCADYALLR